MSNPSRSATGGFRAIEWLGFIFAAVIWCFALVQWAMDVESFAGFLMSAATSLIMTLLFLAWWFTRKSYTLGQRFLIAGCALLMGIAVGVVCAGTIRPPVYVALFGLPIVLAIWGLWVPLTKGRAPQLRVSGLIVCLAVVWSAFLLIRVNGTRGNMRADIHWRWTPTAEQIYLAHASQASPATTEPSARPLHLQPGDWPGFRGPRRDGIVRGQGISLDWKATPPTVLWRQNVGPAWSSMAVVGGCVFTQEQRGPRECVVCRDAMNGREIWVHAETARFDEPLSGPGPRATPMFAGGRIYSQGTLGTLVCLDAATGRPIWSRDVRTDAGAALPIWGFSSSPLVTDDRVIVFTAGEGRKGLLAYSLDGGAPLWTADTGKISYASPQAFDFGSDHLVVVYATEGLFGVDLKDGHIRWQFPLGQVVGLPVCIQACQVNPHALVLGYGASFGAERVELSSDNRSITRGWVTRQMKPSFSDMVYHDGFLYGFDGTVFCCVDASTGVRRWREGRYGAGQVVLLDEQSVMIVTSEDGQAILLRCNPQQSEELGRLPAISGKAWNHPAFAGGRLYMRSDSEMACVQFKPIGNREITKSEAALAIHAAQ